MMMMMIRHDYLWSMMWLVKKCDYDDDDDAVMMMMIVWWWWCWWVCDDDDDEDYDEVKVFSDFYSEQGVYWYFFSSKSKILFFLCK